MNENLYFIKEKFRGKTKKFLVQRKTDGEIIGNIEYCRYVKEYVFSPRFYANLKSDYLMDIQLKLNVLNEERKMNV